MRPRIRTCQALACVLLGSALLLAGLAPKHDARPSCGGDPAWLGRMPESARVAFHAAGLGAANSPALERAIANAVPENPEAIALREAWVELARTLQLDPADAFGRILGDEVTLYARDASDWALLTRVRPDVERLLRERLRPALRDRVRGLPVLAAGAGRIELVPMPVESGVVVLIAPASSRAFAGEVLDAQRGERRSSAPAVARLLGGEQGESPPLAAFMVRDAERSLIAEVRTDASGVDLRAVVEMRALPAPRRPLDAQSLLVLSSVEQDPACVMAMATRGDVLERFELSPEPDALRLIDGRAVARLVRGLSAWSGPVVLACIEPRAERTVGDRGPTPRGIAFAGWVDTLDDQWTNTFSEWIASSSEITLWPRAAGARPSLAVRRVGGQSIARVADRGVWGGRAPDDPRWRGVRTAAWGLEPAATGRESWWFGSIESSASEQTRVPPAAAWTEERLARALAWTTPNVAVDSGVLMRGFIDPGRFLDGFAADEGWLGMLRGFGRVHWEVSASREGALRIEARGDFVPAR